MGIKQLSRLISELAPNAVKVERVVNWRSKRVAIDVSNYLYQFAYKPESKKPNSHIAGFFQLVHELMSQGVMPIMIFDGTPCQAKDFILTQRKALRDQKREKIDLLNAQIDPDNIFLDGTVNPEAASDWQTKTTQVKKLENQLINISDSMWREIKELFYLLGIPVLQASHEADLLASRLCQAGLVYAVISEDLDHLTFGAHRLIRDFNNKRDPDCRVYSLVEVLSSLELTHDQFIDVCILCGCDYTAKIEGIGMKRAYKLIRSHGSIEAIVEAINNQELKKFRIPEEFNYEGARKIFNLEYELEGLNLTPYECRVDVLKPLLINQCRYRESTLDSKFKAILACHQKFINTELNGVSETELNGASGTKLPKPKIKVKKV